MWRTGSRVVSGHESNVTATLVPCINRNHHAGGAIYQGSAKKV
jgi:hypothetical protein